MFTVFLDVDGVLNTRTTVVRTPAGYAGVDDARVEILAKVLAKYGGGNIVLSSDWKEIRNNESDLEYLKERLAKYDLTISDKTVDKRHDRGAGIQNYLELHPEIEEYVILDDNTFDFRDFPKLWERLLLTNGIENAVCASQTPAVEAMVFLDYIKLF